MKKRRRGLVLSIFAFFVLIAGLGVSATIARTFGQEISVLTDVIGTLAAVIGAGAIWHELRRGQDLSEAEFLITLNEGFSSNPDIRLVYSKIEWDRTRKRSTFSASDLSAIVTYVTFFETIQNLLERRMISFSMIDDIFAYRFFAMVHNRHIQQCELLPDSAYHLNTFKLYRDWRAYREREGAGLPDLPELLEETRVQIDG